MGTIRPAKRARRSTLQPGFQSRSSAALGEPSHPLPNFAQRQHAYIKGRFISCLYPIEYTWLWLRTDKLGNAICIEQESVHSSISRPASCSRSKSSSTPTSGESRKNWTRLFGRRDLPLSCSYSSSEIITTPSLPCRVIRCGPSVRASRKTSLNRALAV